MKSIPNLESAILLHRLKINSLGYHVSRLNGHFGISKPRRKQQGEVEAKIQRLLDHVRRLECALSEHHLNEESCPELEVYEGEVQLNKCQEVRKLDSFS